MLDLILLTIRISSTYNSNTMKRSSATNLKYTQLSYSLLLKPTLPMNSLKHLFHFLVSPSLFLPFDYDICGSRRIKYDSLSTYSNVECWYPFLRFDSKRGKLSIIWKFCCILISNLWDWANCKTINLYITFDYSAIYASMFGYCYASILF